MQLGIRTDVCTNCVYVRVYVLFNIIVPYVTRYVVFNIIVPYVRG